MCLAVFWPVKDAINGGKSKKLELLKQFSEQQTEPFQFYTTVQHLLR